MNFTKSLLIACMAISLLAVSTAQLSPTPVAVSPTFAEPNNMPLTTPVATPGQSIAPMNTPTPASTASPAQLDISEPIVEILPENSLLEDTAAQEMVEDLREEVVENGGCNPNVCFAIDGGSFVTPEDFTRQLEFVQIVSAIIGADARSAFAGVQYTRPLSPISKLTTDTDQFLLDVESTEQKGGIRSELRRGIRFCANQLSGHEEDVNKIVILADGRSFFRNAERVARQFRKQRNGNAICAVGIGFGNRSRFLRALTGSRNRVLRIDEYFELLDIIDQLVAEICDL